MKSVLFRSIGVSILLLSLSLFAFADGEMGAGSKADPPSGGNAPTYATTNTTEVTATNTEPDSTDTSDSNYLGWVLEFVSRFTN